MDITDHHYVSFVHGDRYVLNKTQRSLVRRHIWRKRKSTSKLTSIGPLQWTLRAPADSNTDSDEEAARRSEEPKSLPLLASVKTLMTRDRFLQGRTSGDPFDSLPISNTLWPGVSRTFDLFFQGYIKPNVSCSSSPAPDDIKYPILQALLPLAVQNVDLFAALLADVQYWHDVTMLQRRDGGDQVSITTSLPQAVLFYRSQALSHIRHKIVELTQRPAMGQPVPDDSLMIAITYTMGTDTYAGDETSHAIHADALKRLVRMRGGVGSPNLSPLLRHTLLVHNFFLTDECNYPRLFSRDDYAATYTHLTYPAASTQAMSYIQLLNLPPTFQVLFSTFPNLVSLQVVDLVNRLSDWTSLLQRVWLGPSHVMRADRAALLRDDIFRVVEDNLYCLKIMPSLPNLSFDTDQRGRNTIVVDRTANSGPSAPQRKALQAQQSHLQLSPTDKRDESSVDRAFETDDIRVSSPFRRHSRLAYFERTLLLAFLLYGLTCFYPSEAKRFKIFGTAREELTGLLLDNSASPLGGSLATEEVNKSRDDEEHSQEALSDILIWCICVAAEGWRLPDHNGHERLHSRGVELFAVLRDYLDHRLRTPQVQPNKPRARSNNEASWEHLEAILRSGLYCGQRAVEWKLCWEEFTRTSPRLD